MIRYFDDEGAGNEFRVYSLLRVGYERSDPVVSTEIGPSADIRMWELKLININNNKL